MSSALLLHADRQPAAGAAGWLASRGWKLYLSSLSPLPLERTLRACAAAGAEARGMVTDPSRGIAANALLEEAGAAFGFPELIVLNPSARPGKPFLQLDEWDFQRTFESNVSTTFLMLQLYARMLALRSWRGLAVVCLEDGQANPHPEALRITQAAVEEMLRGCGAELARHGLKVIAARQPTEGWAEDGSWMDGVLSSLPRGG